MRAKEYINEMHPIKNTDFDVAFPKVGCFCKLFARCCCRAREEEESGMDEGEDEQEMKAIREILHHQNKTPTTNK